MHYFAFHTEFQCFTYFPSSSYFPSFALLYCERHILHTQYTHTRTHHSRQTKWIDNYNHNDDDGDNDLASSTDANGQSHHQRFAKGDIIMNWVMDIICNAAITWSCYQSYLYQPCFQQCFSIGLNWHCFDGEFKMIGNLKWQNAVNQNNNTNLSWWCTIF